ncbi:MAG: hypothetical protein ACM3II_08265, partial [Rhodospirillaceae bacterium]
MKIETAVADWLSRFETADASQLPSLFHADSHWRDVLALTWRIETFSGRDAVVQALRNAQWPSKVEIDPDRTPPRKAMRAGRDVIEAIFKFETAEGR